MDSVIEVTVTGERTAVVPAPRPAPLPGTGPAAPGRATPAAVRPCRCGHGRDAHEHFRPGSDCATCGCTRYRRR